MFWRNKGKYEFKEMLLEFYHLDILIRTFYIAFEFNVRYYNTLQALVGMILIRRVYFFLFQRLLIYFLFVVKLVFLHYALCITSTNKILMCVKL